MNGCTLGLKLEGFHAKCGRTRPAVGSSITRCQLHCGGDGPLLRWRHAELSALILLYVVPWFRQMDRQSKAMSVDVKPAYRLM
jgi:hypothetical protein